MTIKRYLFLKNFEIALNDFQNLLSSKIRIIKEATGESAGIEKSKNKVKGSVAK